jgi:DNA-binding response OmpR family regulator
MDLLQSLLDQSNYEAIRARNGLEAIVALSAPSKELPDAILLDLGLPIESGVSVLTFLRTVMESGLPVIVLTGRQDLDEENAVRELGVSAYLRKPADPGQVLDALSAALV